MQERDFVIFNTHHDKNSQQANNLIKGPNGKPVANILLNSERSNAFSPESKTTQEATLLLRTELL